MYKQFAQDLCIARRKAGLTQSDVAHLMDANTKLVGAFEKGAKLPDLAQLCELSLIYGRSFETLFAELMEHGKAKLHRQLPSQPALKQESHYSFNRDKTVSRALRSRFSPRQRSANSFSWGASEFNAAKSAGVAFLSPRK